jgi:hypothetical protein
MHSDTLRIFVSNAITDAWGNALDLRNNNIPLDTGTLDTTLTAYVDTSFLQITYHTPAANDTVLPNESIQIHFNYPLATNCIFFTDTIQSLDLQSAIEDSNHTVRITSSLSNSSYIPIKPLQLTNENHTLLIKPRYNLFSEDTVFVRISHTICDENGRTLDGNYDRVYHYPADTADYYEFSFYTGPADYYLFPNPFNFRNPEHVAKGGVAFKNLHRIPKIKVDDEIDLRIYTLDGLLVYSTHRLKKSIRLNEEGSVPEITWPIRNNHNRIVASGLYLYTIGHGHTILQKGKIAIIR